MRIFSLLLIFITTFVFSYPLTDPAPVTTKPDTGFTDSTSDTHIIDKGPSRKAALWADSLLKTLSTEEKIGQLFMVAAYSNRDTGHVNDVLRSIEAYHVGGLIFFQGGPVRQANLTNLYQSRTRIPLMIGMDAEWGLGMRLDSCVRYPKQMALGAIQNDSLIEQMGEAIGQECRRLGVQVNFAPVADVNNNSANPVINIRSFGERKKMVATKALAYFKGLHKANVMACAKHFPGHGDTDTDSHLGLPVLSHNQHRLDTLEFYPFKKLIEAGIPSVMVGHMNIPSMDTTKNVSSVFSHIIIEEFLKKKMQFNGLVFTDALNMQGAMTRYMPGEIELRAFLAGNDVLLCSDSLDLAFKTIQAAVNDGLISKERLDNSVKKILMAKYHYGLNKKQKVKTANLYNDLNLLQHQALAKVLTEKSITVLKNNRNILPLKKLDTLNLAVISIGDSTYNTFIKSTERYAPAKRIMLGKTYDGNILDSLKDNNLVIIGLHYSALFPQRNYQVTPQMLHTLEQLQTKKHVLVVMGNVYYIDQLNTGREEALVLTYENTPNAQDVVGMTLFGGATATGKLPVTLNNTYHYGKHIELKQLTRFKFILPEEIGINSRNLARIDSIANEGIDQGAYPGCVVLAAKDGKVFYQKAFGYHTFDKTRPVRTTDIYDLASVSKIAGTVTSLMKLTDQKKFNVNDKLGKYLPDELDSTVYARTVIKQILTHQAGFVDWIPFFLKVVKKGVYDPKVFKTKPEPGYTTRIHDHLYILDTYEDTIYKTIRNTPLRGSFTYKYSDLGYYFLKRVVQKKTGKPLNEFAYETFYKPLGLQTMGYLPRQRFSLDRIPPTEDDKTFRYALVHGDVHDQGAAMVGGVGGHAGLFADANDVGVMFQMMMNYGTYGGERYISENTLREWTKCQFCPHNRRGLGFDRPTMSDKGPTCNCVSAKSFGHTGFTGITAWADPESRIVYVFLSNRSNPVADNPKIINLGTRTRIQQVIYDAVNAAGKPIL
jgi:beta-glucosidase-like glycosyl hydrolase/CubicO group peptidase (beta-lactamase class C family)